MKKFNLILMAIMLLMLSGCRKNGDVDFSKTDTVTFYDLTVEMPQKFTNDAESGNEYIQFYSYIDEEKYNCCMLYLAISDYPHSDMKEAIKEGLYEEPDFTYSEKNINGYNWSNGYMEESVKHKKTYYVINNKGKEYALSYDDFGSGEECAEALKIIEKSLKFK